MHGIDLLGIGAQDAGIYFLSRLMVSLAMMGKRNLDTFGKADLAWLGIFDYGWHVIESSGWRDCQ
jgi:hypothetical protein